MSDLLFDFPKYKITKDVRLIELFAGVGSQMMSLRNLKERGVIKQNIESHFVCEFDKYAIASYNAIHGTNYPTTDVTKIHASDLNITERDKYEYILTYSFPCTDLSLAGKRAGMEKGSGTRSGLLWEVERLLIECEDNLPQILLMENVPQVITAEGFSDWLSFLKSKHYVSHYKVLNAKDHGVAQSRERCFMISILSDEYVDYDFPKEHELDKRIIDYLEEDVNEKYYMNDEKAKKLIYNLAERNELPNITSGASLQKSEDGHFKSINDATLKVEKEYFHTITARYWKGIAGNGDNAIIERRKQ